MAKVVSTRDALAWHEGGDSFGSNPSSFGTIAADGINILVGNTQVAHLTTPEGNLCLGVGITSAPGAQKIRAVDSGNNRAFITMQNTDSTPAPATASAAFELLVTDAPGTGATLLENFNQFHASSPSECHLYSSMQAGMRIRTSVAAPIMFDTSATQRAVITAAGLVGINHTAPGSTLTVEGSQAVAVTNVTVGTTTLDNTHHTIFADATGGVVVVRLPTLATLANRDRVYVIKKVDASANAVNVQCPLGITLDGVAGITALTAQYQSLTICGGSATEYFII